MGWNPADGIRRTHAGDGTLIAIQTEIMPDLQMQGAVTKGGASFYAFGTTDTQLFVNDIFKVRFLYEPTLYGRCRTKLIFCAGFQFGPGFEIPPTQITVAAEIIGMNALNRRFRPYTFRGTSTALCTFKGIDLPNILLPRGRTSQR
jgi:hypothetical protein